LARRARDQRVEHPPMRRPSTSSFFS
jgi:hypothetical protein